MRIYHVYHAGFRRDLNCTAQIIVLRRILEDHYWKQLALISKFADFLKDFDSINRAAMSAVLIHYVIPDSIVAAIKCVNDNSASKVRFEREYSESFGSKQECFKATHWLLFLSLLPRICRPFISALDFADGMSFSTVIHTKHSLTS